MNMVDERIVNRIRAELAKDEGVDESVIKVSVSEGEVTLSGNVKDVSAKQSAEADVWRIHGVHRVNNNLTY